MRSPSLQQSKLLVVDDDAVNLDILVSLLDHSYDLRTAVNGEVALNLIAEGFTPDLILLAIMMPGMDGYKVCQRLQSDKETQHIPIIFLTSLDSEEDEVKGLELGAVDYITKPFNPEIVRLRVQTHLKLKQSRDHFQELIDKKIEELKSVQRQEREKDALLQSILMSVPVAIGFIVDRKMVWVNQRTTEMSGYSRVELEGQQTRMLYPSTEVDNQVAEVYPQIQKTGYGSFETVWRTKTGGDIDVFVNATALDKTDLSAGVIFAALDITQQKTAEQALLLSEDKYSRLFKLSPDAITLSRMSDGSFLEVNQVFTKLSGWSVQEVLGRSSIDLNLWCSSKDRERMISALCKYGEVTNLEVQLQHKDGHIAYCLISVRKIKIGDEDCLLSITRDITKQKQIERDIIKAKEEWESTFDAMTDMVTIHDKNMIIVRANKAAHDFSGFDYGTLNGKKCCEILWGSAETCHGCPLLTTIATGQKCSETLSYNNPDRTLQVTTAPIPAKDGQPEYFVHVARDITDQQRLEREVSRANRLASLGELAAGVAHEINNPNALILYNSDILDAVIKDLLLFMEENPPADTGRLFGGLTYQDVTQDIPPLLPTIHDSAQRIKRIVNDLRDFSRQDGSVIAETIEVNPVVHAAVRLVGNPIKKATDHFTLNLAESLPAVTGVAGRLEQVVINLLLNACQTLENHSQEISISTVYDAALKQVQIIVTDAGPGMTADVLEHIFEPFMTTKRARGGTGLGLSVSARIIKDHHGTIKFESTPGVGTTATISLPVGKEDDYAS